MEALKEVENGIRAGWDTEKERWFPHESLEGGTRTIAYGHKLSYFEAQTGTVVVGGYPVDIYQTGLTEEEAVELLKRDLEWAEENLKNRIGDYTSFSTKHKQVLQAVEFNTGSVHESTWPKLLRAIRTGNDLAVRLEMVTSYKDPSGTRIRLDRRARILADAIGLRH